MFKYRFSFEILLLLWVIASSTPSSIHFRSGAGITGVITGGKSEHKFYELFKSRDRNLDFWDSYSSQIQLVVKLLL